eukprot:CAMPEP_0116128706 /NCGR_PEP_ID=MMETSP0329-20121206/7502_1 /TAXON_ID=697910 /ORGANISM="Pseudo-nitzschia arenysensis, Strain B593" /LENGTH=204 /DNA_ID=CAMNT_0003622861 /DNA_START=92 /DNA_END=706 /DNA_ORIENTATION=+
MATAIDPTKTPDEIVEDIEAAEEAKDTEKVVAYLALVSSNENAGEEDWAEAAEAALDSLYRLVKGGDANTDESLFHLSAVFNCLNAWEEEEAIVEVGLGCLVALASKANKKEESSSENDDDEVAIPVEFVLDLMKDFGDESTIQEQACLAIEGLALWNPTWKKELANAEGIKEELVAAKNERITNERNKKYPVQAAKALGIELE